MKPGLPCAETTVVEGDHLSYSIAAASILAKVARDKMMRELHCEHPRYGWEHNAGYGTREHRDGDRGPWFDPSSPCLISSQFMSNSP